MLSMRATSIPTNLAHKASQTEHAGLSVAGALVTKTTTITG